MYTHTHTHTHTHHIPCPSSVSHSFSHIVTTCPHGHSFPTAKKTSSSPQDGMGSVVQFITSGWHGQCCSVHHLRMVWAVLFSSSPQDGMGSVVQFEPRASPRSPEAAQPCCGISHSHILTPTWVLCFPHRSQMTRHSKFLNLACHILPYHTQDLTPQPCPVTSTQSLCDAPPSTPKGGVL
jgi:hypothetical protein